MNTKEVKFSAEQVEAAAARCKARGIKKLYPTEWEAAMRLELGITAEQAEKHELAVIKAADDRLTKGELELHAARIAAGKSELAK